MNRLIINKLKSENGENLEQMYRAYKAANFSLLKVIFDFHEVKRIVEGIEPTEAMTFGNLVDDMMTADGDFLKNYAIVDGPYPTDKKMKVLKEIADHYPNIDKADVVRIARENGYYNNYKDDTVYKKVMDKNAEEIIEALGKGAEIITSEDYQRAHDIAEKMLTWDKALDYLEGFELYAQVPLIMDFTMSLDTFEEVPLKGLVDIVAVNHDTKEIILIDIKMSENFMFYYRKRKLALQAAIYSVLAYDNKDNALKAFGVDSSYKVKEFLFYVWDKGVNLPYMYRLKIEYEELLDNMAILENVGGEGQQIGNKLLEYIYGVYDFTGERVVTVIPSLIERLERYMLLEELEFKDDPDRVKGVIDL